MSDRKQPSTPPLPPLPPEPEHSEPGKAADELLSHGLLTFLNRDTPAETDRRVRGLMRHIAAEQPETRAPAEHRRLTTRRLSQARRWVALAACLVIAAGLVYLGFPVESTAQAMVRQSVAAFQIPEYRNFELRVQPTESDELRETPVGSIESLGRDLFIVRYAPSEDVVITAGRDREGPWMVHPDGRTDRNPLATGPRWFSPPPPGDTRPMLPESLDRVLEELVSFYTLTHAQERDTDGALIEHITGIRKPPSAAGAAGTPARGGPRRIELWLNPADHSIKRVELFFPDRHPPQGPGGRNAGDRGRRPDGPGPRGDGPPPPPRPEGGPSGPGGFRNGPGPGDQRPEHRGGGENQRPLRGDHPWRIQLRPAPPRPEPVAADWFSPQRHAKRP